MPALTSEEFHEEVAPVDDFERRVEHEERALRVIARERHANRRLDHEIQLHVRSRRQGRG